MCSITKKFELVIFDLDGTITRPVLDFDKIRAELSIKDAPVWETIMSMPEEKRYLAEQILIKYELEAANRAELNEGAEEILDKLNHRNIRSAILTRNCKRAWEIARDKFNIKVAAAFTRESGYLKPDPLSVLQITDYFKIAPENTLVVGDYLFDIQAGKSAGAKAALLINNGNVPEYSAIADFIIYRLDEILEIVDNYNNKCNGQGITDNERNKNRDRK